MDSDPEPLSLDFSKNPEKFSMIACIGWNRSFGGYLAFLRTGSGMPFKSIDRGREPIDLIAVSGQSKPASKGRMKPATLREALRIGQPGLLLSAMNEPFGTPPNERRALQRPQGV